MSDLMFYGVLRMPYEMAMESEISRRQFYSRVQQAANRIEAADNRLGIMRQAFHINMLRAYPEKSHGEISAAIDKACGLVAAHIAEVLPRELTVFDHFDVPMDPESEDGKDTIEKMNRYIATGELPYAQPDQDELHRGAWKDGYSAGFEAAKSWFTAQNVRDAADALRYRHVRDPQHNGYSLAGPAGVGNWHVIRKMREGEGEFFFGERLDAVVDGDITATNTSKD